MTGLTAGTSYKFFVKARNIIGQSIPSSEVTILAAQISDAPTSLSNDASITNANSIGLIWSAPLFNGGSPITSYKLQFDSSTNGVTFTDLV